MPMCLKNLGSTFHRVMDCIFCDIECAFTYLEDILIYSPNEEQCFRDRDLVFLKLQEYGLKISLEKCVFNQESQLFLEHLITPEGLRPPEETTAEIMYIPNQRNLVLYITFLVWSVFIQG